MRVEENSLEEEYESTGGVGTAHSYVYKSPAFTNTQAYIH